MKKKVTVRVVAPRDTDGDHFGKTVRGIGTIVEAISYALSDGDCKYYKNAEDFALMEMDPSDDHH